MEWGKTTLKWSEFYAQRNNEYERSWKWSDLLPIPDYEYTPKRRIHKPALLKINVEVLECSDHSVTK